MNLPFIFMNGRDKRDIVIVGFMLVLLACFLYVCPVYSDVSIFYNSVSQNTPNYGWNNLTFDTDVYDPFDMHSVSVNNKLLIIPNDGDYLITFSMYSGLYSTELRISKNGNPLSGSVVLSHMEMSAIATCKKYDVITIQAFNPVTIPNSEGVYPRCSIVKLNSSSGNVTGGSEMTTTQFNELFALIAMICICVGILTALDAWHFTKGDG